MKTTNILIRIALIILIISGFIQFSSAQGAKTKRKILTVLNIDSQGTVYTPVQLGNMVRLEIDKLDTFEVTDRYDVAYLLEKNKLSISNCFGKICLVETGKSINSDKILGGSIEVYSNTTFVTLKLIDVATEMVEKTYIREYLNLPDEMQNIIRVSVREMFNLPNPAELVSQLTKPFNYETLINNPNKERLNLSGPRMGFIGLFGPVGKLFTSSKNVGGYDAAYPVLFQCGYQFEIQYLSEGNYSALFEILPMISGLDQSMVIPSLTFMNGLRNSINGWELAFGPSFNLSNMASVYMDGNVQRLESEWNGEGLRPDFKVREDSRGELKFRSMFIIAIGKSFKSGKMNIPVNVYAIPARDGIRVGISFGYNAKKNR